MSREIKIHKFEGNTVYSVHVTDSYNKEYLLGYYKILSPEILSEIEQTGRGPYTGSMGYINHDGTMDLNILIRTITKYKNNVSIN